MNKITKVALPAMAICGAIFAAPSVLAYGRTGALADLPTELTVNVKESAYITNESDRAVDNAAKASAEAALTTAGLDLTGYNLDVWCGLGSGSMYDCSASLANPEGQNIDNADFTIKYSNTDDLSTTDREAIKNKLNLGSFMGDPTNIYIMHEPGVPFYTPGETICTDNTCASSPAEFSKSFYAEEKTALTSKLSQRAGESMNFYYGTIYGGIATPEGFEVSSLAEVFAIVGDNLVDCGAIASVHGYGYDLADGAVITYQDLNPKGTNYTTMAAKLSDEGHNEVLGAYELQLVGSHTGNITATFNVGAKYNGKTVVILHKKSDNSYEEFEAVVANGKVSVEVSSLSPFVVALKNSSATQTATTTETTSEVKSPDTGAAPKSDNSGATASVFATVISAVLALGAFATAKKITKTEE